jgi:hypothetical protein
VVHGRRGRGGLAPDESHAEQVVGQARNPPGILERRVHDQTRADLYLGAAGDLRAADAEPPQPGEWRVAAKLLLCIETQPALHRTALAGQERLDAPDAGAQAGNRIKE